MSIVLALDTSTFTAHAALTVDGKLAAKASSAQDGAAESLTALIRSVLESSGVPAPDVSMLAVCVGPGSFTGLRTGIGSAQGFAFAFNLPIVGISSLAAASLADAAVGEQVLAAARSAPEEFITCAFRKVSPVALEALTPVAAMRDSDREGRLAEFSGGGERVRFLPVSEDAPGGPEVNLAARLAAAVDLEIIGPDELARLHCQRTARGCGLEVLYAKPVSAKTIEQRQQEAAAKL